jgi:Immunoglobulin I-set domain/Immunoglobulin domain
MMKVAEFLHFRIARSLSTFRSQQNVGIAAAPDSFFAAPIRTLHLAGSVSTTPRWGIVGVVRILVATLTLLTLTACGGGWNYGGTPPTITSQPASQTVNVGQTATFNVTATGTGPLSYQWFLNGTAVSGATSTSYTTPAAASTDSGSIYTVTVTNASGSVTSTPATLTVAAGGTTVNPDAPLIVTQPANQTVAVGQTATFSVTATGAATLTYQWFKGGVAIAGATSSTYTTPATVSGDSGSLFTVTVTNAQGTVTSTPATLTVTATTATLPAITSQPVSQTVTAGQTATFSVTATGTGPLSYQWYDGGVAVTGATSSTYTTPPTIAGNSGSVYTVTVTNSGGTVTSSPATLTVNTAPLIVTQPASQTVTVGQTATFSVTASGTAPLTYQWFKGGTAITGATSSSYTTPATVIGDSGSLFTVVVTNTSGTVTGGPATLTVTGAPTITTEPANQTVPAGQTATFNVVASGAGTLTYQWYKGGVAIGGATSSTYTTPATATSDSGSSFTVTVTNAGGTVTSTPATLTVTTSPIIVTQPANQTVTAGQTATFSVTASGTGTLTYQWYKGGAAISGATSSSYTTPATVIGDSGSLFTVIVTNTVGTATGGPATLTVNTAPIITSQPANQTVNAGKTATFSVTASGAGTLTYQWFKGGVAIAGATSSTYTTPATVSGDSGSLFTVTVTNASGTVTSTPATLTVNTPPTITTQPVSQTVTVGQTATFSVTATGTAPLSYQWYKGTTAIGGATSSTYTTPVTVIGDNNSQYSVVVTNIAGTATSTQATLTVKNSAPLASSLVCNPSTAPYNSSVNLIPTFSGGTGVIGSTGVGSVDITASATSGNSYPTPGITSAKTYTLSVTGTGGTVVSTTCNVTPAGVTISSISPANQTIAPGKQAFTATVTGGATDNVTWTATAGTFAGNVWTSPNTVGTYTITATSVDEPSVSATTTITISLPVIITQPASENVCTNSTTTLTVVANYATSYQWNLNGTPIPGATSASYFIPSAIAMDSGSYTVTVTNAAGSVTSNAAKVVVGSTITSNPVSLSILAGQTATFSVAAAGEPPFTYQWYVIAPGTSTGNKIAGATSSTYTTPAETTNSNGAKFFATVTDACGGSAITSATALLTVTDGHSPPTIITQPVSQTVPIGGTATFTVVASGSPTLTYQWYSIFAGNVTGIAIAGATSASYTVPASATSINSDQTAYYVIVTNPYGQAVSQTATLSVGNGIQITKQPIDVFVNAGAPATFSVTATSTLPLTYQWYEAAPGSSTFTPIAGATSASYTVTSTTVAETGSVFHVVVSNGSSPSLTSNSAALFVGTLSGVSNLCNGWTWLGNALAPTPSCAIQLAAATTNQSGEIVWPTLISTADIQLSFTITTSDTSNPPADGFAMVLGDPSLGATLTSTGAPGQGLGAEGIPGFVLAFDDYENVGDPPIPYLGVGRGETALWENPYFNVNTTIPALATFGATVSHNYVVSIIQGIMTVTMDGTQVFSGSVSVPPVAYLYFTASTGEYYEQTVISNLSATVSAPSN